MKRQTGRIFGYARPSHGDTSCAKQIAEILSVASVSEAAIFAEKKNSSLGSRESWRALLATGLPGDQIVISHLSRLGRSISEVFSSAGELFSKGMSLSIVHPSDGLKSLDPEQLQSILQDMSNLDRSLRSEFNQTISLRKPLGSRGGAKPIVSDEQILDGMQRVTEGAPVSTVSNSLGLSRQAFHKRSRRLRMQALNDPSP